MKAPLSSAYLRFLHVANVFFRTKLLSLTPKAIEYFDKLGSLMALQKA